MSDQTNCDQYEPEEALSMYVAEAKKEKADSTVRGHKSRVGHFVEFCDENNIEYLNELSPKNLYQYRIWRGEGITKVTLKSQLDTLRVFLRFCERINAIPADFSERVQPPSLEDGENQRSTIVQKQDAESILEHLKKFEYSSNRHATLLLLWKCGMRIGAVRSLDVDDVDLQDGYIDVRHRPESDTPLKNKQRGERHIAISVSTVEVLEDYIHESRNEVEEESGRRPLITTRQSSRVHTTTLRGWSYKLTRPCALNQKCPHNRNEATCEATEHGQESKCPSSKSAHAWRRGAITHWLRDDVPARAVSDRANVSEDVIDKHYDERSSQEKMEQRRKFFS